MCVWLCLLLCLLSYPREKKSKVGSESAHVMSVSLFKTVLFHSSVTSHGLCFYSLDWEEWKGVDLSGKVLCFNVIWKAVASIGIGLVNSWL